MATRNIMRPWGTLAQEDRHAVNEKIARKKG